ncbi:MAG: hypothetical protein NUV51_03725 [Sulfuricaulis sp.]|nr:hypothetical protein [Sulfuricaulis sp.]
MITHEKAIRRLKACQPPHYDDDREHAQSRATAVLLEFLRSVGYGDIAEEWNKTQVW